jgi:Anti-sigma-K factor rskA, C-terminal
VTWEHDRVEELLAGHALGGLDPEDAALAERALAEHIPECEPCRRAWDGYREVAADLALVAPAVTPSDTLDARVRRALRRPERVRPLVAAGTAAAALLVAFSGFSMIRAGQIGDRLEQAQVAQRTLFDAVQMVAHPEHETIPLIGDGPVGAALYYVPGESPAILMAKDLPKPRHEYHVWFVSGSEVWHAGVLDVERGRAVLGCRTDPGKWEAVLLTDEAGQRPRPTSSPLVSALVAE